MRVLRKARLRSVRVRFRRNFFGALRPSRSIRIYGDIRGHLETQGTPIGGNDLLIAATAIAHDFILVTHNTREFGRVPGLKMEDWEEESDDTP